MEFKLIVVGIKCETKMALLIIQGKNFGKKKSWKIVYEQELNSPKIKMFI